MTLDPFTKRRLENFIRGHREAQGQLPTLKDLEAAGFSEDLIDRAVRERILELFYVTLTNGMIVKGYKLSPCSE